jgi:hypothetical protein
MRIALALAAFGLVKVWGQSLPVISISGQPFSADEVTIENARPNVHGVVPMKTVRVYRDSAGRTRVDVSIPPDHTATPFVSIQDPVAGVHYSLDAKNKIARRLTFPAPRSLPGPDPPAMSGSAMLFFPGRPIGDRGVPSTSESLGTQLIEGLSAEGKRITSASSPMPGCDRNVAVTESWYSPELRMTLLQKHSNCFGDGTASLENINRAEPDPLLFGVPWDYTIVEQEWSHGVKPADPPAPTVPAFEFPKLPPFPPK